MSDIILEVSHLRTSFFTHLGEVQAVRDVSFDVKRGEALGIVGESGCGKSVTMLSVMKLVQEPGKILGGAISFKGKDLLAKSKAEMRSIRGNEISMIFQDPLTSLNPVFSIGNQLMESILSHNRMPRNEARKKAVDLLKLVEIPSPEERLRQYPYEMSGGMRQRVMIAMALAGEPDLLIADEPTTALDVTIQAQILGLMKGLMSRLNTAIVIITHDLGVVADFCERIIVMYGGQIVESGNKRQIFYNPLHPYTVGLLGAVPGPDMRKEEVRLATIPGSPPDLVEPPKGCPFYSRCLVAMKVCGKRCPSIESVGDGQEVRCWHYSKDNPGQIPAVLQNSAVRLRSGGQTQGGGR